MTSPHQIRLFGDPVLKLKCRPVDQIDNTVKQLATDMIETMYQAPGVGLAAPQVGVSKRMFVFDAADGKGPFTLINPEIIHAEGEFTDEEGCLSVPGLQFPLTRSDQVVVIGLDLDGNQIEFVASGYEAKILQHELDHLDGILYVQLLAPEHRKEAMRTIRDRQMKAGT